ncbi:cysteine-rich receptor-like protein kinase 2 [Helianthus annuus]|nr:cysteine-rich receptor-like protein kinase 2 [Helianthus annuus]
MDFGASFHATHSSEALHNLIEGDFRKVKLVSDKILDVTGMGDIVLKTSVGSRTLEDGMVIPSLKRYEASADFYNNPNVNEDGTGGGFSICGNVSASQPLSSYTQIVDDLLSDIRDATPKTSNSYVASLRRITYENATVYAITQCAENINQDICQGCMNTAYNKLKECLPNTEGKYFDNACFARYSETPLFNDNQTIDITNILKGVHSNKVAIIVGAIGGLVLLFLIFVLCLFRGRKNSKKAGQVNTDIIYSYMEHALNEEDLKGTLNYDYKDLQLATNNFSKENILGKGGFGEVYKAIIDDKNVVAVKKLHVQDVRAKEEFENEVKLISNIHHRNLLRLLGWSSEGSDLFLVLEYMANSSLDQFLWGAKNGTLDWNQRYEIILGIAKGLTHLHSECHVKIIHRDIKSSNILLSDDFKAKIADFGLAMFQPEDETHVNTKFAGTLGYAAPEYVLHGALSNKVDTYNFGIVILEIISGRRSTDVNSDRPSMEYLLEHVRCQL